MYGIPADLDLRALHGRRLDQLCLGSFDLQFHFSGGYTITVTGSWRLLNAQGTTLDESDGPVAEPPGNRSRAGWRLANLLSDTVQDSRVEPPLSFTLVFSSGHQLVILDDSHEYESFSIQPGDIFV
jgi:hypothetical protein